MALQQIGGEQLTEPGLEIQSGFNGSIYRNPRGTQSPWPMEVGFGKTLEAFPSLTLGKVFLSPGVDAGNLLVRHINGKYDVH